MDLIFERTAGLTERITHYCPGCTHGIIHRLIAECLVELELREQAVGVVPVGCSVLAYNYFNCDVHEAAHGRAAAVATGVKRSRPELTVFSYQGDGDLASIGLAEIIHAANRGEKITVIFVNNAIYGMTGGQMAPTTLPGQVTSTCPFGRDVQTAGWPIRIAELLATLRTPGYIVRSSVHNPRHVVMTKKIIKQAFSYQQAGTCFSLVEVLSTCPTNWGCSPLKATEWLQKEMIPYYPLGVKKRPGEEK